MKIQEKFTVDAPADEVWAFLIDPERVAAALPGARITEKVDENTYKGGMAVNVGPLSAAYSGTVAFELDEENRAATVRARGQGKAGMGNADMKMTSRVVALGARRNRGDGRRRPVGDRDPGPTWARHDAARQQEDVQGVHRGSGEGARFMIARMSITDYIM